MWNCVKAQLDGEADISLSAGNTGVVSYLKDDLKDNE